MRTVLACLLLFLSEAVHGATVTGTCDTEPKACIAHFAGNRAAAISYTFDDNLRDQYLVAVPMLNEVSLKGTFFVITGATAETREKAEKKQCQKRAWGSISWSELEEMAAEGHEIASHTWTHPNLGKVPAQEVDEQFCRAYDTIKQRIGKPPLTVAFPFNASTPEVRAAALKYYLAYRAYQMGTSQKSTAASLNGWADRLVKEKQWGIIMAHGIVTGYAAMRDRDILRAHWKYVKRREEIWVDTFANIARYEKERDDAKLTLLGGAGAVTCILRSTLDPQLYTVPLTLVIEVTHAISASAKQADQELPVRVEKGSIIIEAVPNAQPIIVRWK